MMSENPIYIKLDGRGNRLYYPGETLAGSYYLDEIRNDLIDAVEVSILWFTEGKGNEDFGIHAFWRRSNQAGDWIDPRHPGRFSTMLPNSPLTYDGIFVKINWCVRVRVFLTDGRQIIEELTFRLGDIPNVRTIKADHPLPTA
ncbi:MAG: hypothetical protein Q4G69_07360 [Planctomycetia bacterium]|nr:hypothetical protein [Planctomycetia bacterium]